MHSDIQRMIRCTVMEMIEDSISEAKIEKLVRKHQDKIHFIPLRYRVIGGILQSLNIKFGNFIEVLIGNIVEIDPGIKMMSDSGKRLRLRFTPETDAAIDKYITERQLPSSPDDCTPMFDNLLAEIIRIETTASVDDRQGLIKDVDALFQTDDGQLVFAEVKYNDDHDTGKFADINRKFIKTWAGLSVRLKITDPDQLFPVLYYFNPAKRYGPIHTPSRNIMRGPQLFERFLQTRCADVDQYLADIGDDPEILQVFDEMYDRVRNSSLSASPS